MSTSSRIPYGIIAALVALASGAPAALAGWGTDPVTVTPTTASIPLVEGCSDGAYGVFVAWQEGSPTGMLRAQHLLPTGDLDPAWPATGAIACNVVAARTELTALPDRMGGVYLLWKEGNSLFAKRLDASGAGAAGWPTRGRSLGSVLPDSPRPSAIADGANGFYAAWSNTFGLAYAVRLGPSNTGVGGWPNGARLIALDVELSNTLYWPQLTLAPDGGVFAAWASATADESSSPSAWRVRRLGPTGVSAPGWPADGVSLGSFQRPLLGSSARGSLLGLGPDGRGGVFVLIGDPVDASPVGEGAQIQTRLHRLQGDGQTASNWPAAGVSVAIAPEVYHPYEAGSNPDYSYRVLPNGGDGAFAGVPGYMIHFGTIFGYVECDGVSGCGGSPSVSGLIAGQEFGVSSDGGLFLASFYPHGATGPYQPGAFLSVTQTPGKGVWSEYQAENVVTFYTDIGFASLEDGGAVLLWSQVLERVGLFARRFNSAGEVTAVGPEPASTFGLTRLRFVRGEGVRATISVPGSSGRFELFDLAGRRIASQSITAGEVTLAGTAALPSGLYFGRLVAGKGAVTGKLIVAR